MDHLNDTAICSITKTNPTTIYENKNNDTVKTWTKGQYLNITTERVQIQNFQLSKIYGLQKIHKNNIPLIPIISALNPPFITFLNIWQTSSTISLIKIHIMSKIRSN